jgi:hypothetical protein
VVLNQDSFIIPVPVNSYHSGILGLGGRPLRQQLGPVHPAHRDPDLPQQHPALLTDDRELSTFVRINFVLTIRISTTFVTSKIVVNTFMHVFFKTKLKFSQLMYLHFFEQVNGIKETTLGNEH